MEGKRNRIPYKKPPEIYISSCEYAQLTDELNWDLCKEKCDHIDELLEKECSEFGGAGEVYYGPDVRFYSRWGKTKENIVIFDRYSERWWDKAIENIDWENVDNEKLYDIRNMLEMDIEPEHEFLDRWGSNKENRAILKRTIKSWYDAKEWDS